MTEPTVRHGRKVRLRHLTPADLPALHRLASDPQVRGSWRTRGDLWSFAQLEHHLSADPHVALVATAIGDDEPFGLLELHDVDPIDARAQLSVLVHPSAWASGVAGEAAVLFARFAFDALPLDKLACTVQATNERASLALRRTLDHEGTLRRHLNVHGTWIDLELFALWKDRLPAMEARVGVSPGSSGDEGAPPAPELLRGQRASLRTELGLILADVGLAPEQLDEVTFGELDSLAVLELVLATEQRLGRPLAIEALALDQPVADLLSLVGEDRRIVRGG